MNRSRQVLELVLTGNTVAGIANWSRRKRRQPRRLLDRSTPRMPTRSSRRINRLLAALPVEASYLEIGVATGRTLESVCARTRQGVDPAPGFDTAKLPRSLKFFTGTSDDFFASLPPDENYDLVFLDGLHTFDQTYRDLRNSLRHLRDGGVILIDDTVPTDEVSAIPDQNVSYHVRRQLQLAGMPWQGDVWKVVVAIEQAHPELDYRTIVDSPHGQTLVWKRQEDESTLSTVDSKDETLAVVAELSYSVVFSERVPGSFRQSSESQAIAAWQICH